MKKSILCCGAAIAASLAGAPANAANIVLIDQGGVTGSQAEMGFKIAAAYWSAILTNNVTIRLGVSYAALPTGVIGSTGSSGMDYTATKWENGVAATKSNSTLDQTAILPTLTTGAAKFITSGANVGTLGVNTTKKVYDTSTSGANSVNNKTLYLNTSVVKAVGGTATYDSDPTSQGYNPQQLDGDITFSNTFGFDFNPTDGISPNTFDFIGTAIHEMGHALGFVSGVDEYDYFGAPNGPGQTTGNTFNFNTTSWFSSLDMFRYSADPTNVSGTGKPVLDESVGAASYFSIDGGKTQLFGDSRFSTGSYNGDGNQASHWKDTNSCTVQLGIMDPTECYQQSDYVTALDLAAFDAMGWNLNLDILQNSGYHVTTSQIYNQYANAAVPEPTTWAMLIAGFGLVGVSARRRATRMIQAI